METIELITLKDIREKIPKDRLDAFLLDLKAWVLMDGQDVAKSYGNIIEEIAKTIGVEVKTLIDDSVLHWVDDGQEGLSGIDLTMPDGKVVQSVRFNKKAS